jgi:alkylhydroperoxidase/carboxymuconolactone decarboxylase family protein YurZ
MSESPTYGIPPKKYQQFKEAYPDLVTAYEELGARCHKAGPLEKKTRELVKLAMAIGAGLEGASHAHARAARSAGATPDEIRHVAILAVTTLGFPSSMRAMTWVNDTVS